MKPVLSESEPGKIYHVVASTLFNDPVCDCPGFTFRAQCKHIKKIEEERCQWFDSSEDSEPYDCCPICNDEAVDYELKPEYPNA